MKSITFGEVVKEFKTKKYKSESCSNWSEFYRQQNKNFKDILVTLDIVDAVSYLKNNSGHYSFDEKDIDFLVQVLLDYIGDNFQNMRKGLFINVPDEYIVWVVEGFIKIFNHNKLKKDIKNQIILKMYKRTDYPLRKRQYSILQMHNKLEEVVNYIFEPKMCNYMTVKDNYTWLTAMEQDFFAFIKRWNDLYYRMGEERNDELNDIAWKVAEQMTKEEEEDAMIDFAISGPLLYELKKNKEYQRLLCRQKALENPQKGFIKDKIKEYEQISMRIKAIYEETYIKVRREILPSAILLKPFKQLYGNEYETMLDSEKLLNNVMQERKADIENERRFEESHKWEVENYPQIDFDKLHEDVENICLLGNEE